MHYQETGKKGASGDVQCSGKSNRRSNWNNENVASESLPLKLVVIVRVSCYYNYILL